MNKALMMIVTSGIMLIVIGLILSIGGKIQTETKENTATKTTITINNESIAPTGVYHILDCGGGDVDSPSDTSIKQIYNGSTDLILCGEAEGLCLGTLAQGNYTLLPNNGEINFTIASANDASGFEASGNNFTVTYSCSTYGDVWSIGRNGTESLLNLSNWSSTIAVVIAAVVILTLLLAGFGVWLYNRE